MISFTSNARWIENGTTIAGGNGEGNALNQLSFPEGICVADDGTVYIADWGNDRIVAWKPNETTGRVVANTTGKGDRWDQLNKPTDVRLDKATESLIICDHGNRRVMRWSFKNETTEGERIIDFVSCCGLAIDDQNRLYVTDIDRHEVRRYRRGDLPSQLNWPNHVFIDDQGVVYVSEEHNHRVTQWMQGATEGTVVAGNGSKGQVLTQLSYPGGLFIDANESVYVAEWGNHRVTCWHKGSKKGEVIAGGHGMGKRENQFHCPTGLCFDRQNHLYVVDCFDHRVQRFDMKL